MQYKENFWFRKRTHTLLSSGIKTEQNSFFNSSSIEIKFSDIGSILQYRSDLKLSEVVTSIVFFILGIKGLVKSTQDNILFAISVILIATGTYWLINILFNLKHVGSFYFSDSITKSTDALEIKSKYPPSNELNQFLHEILKAKKDYDIDNLIDTISPELTSEEIQNEILYLKRKYSLHENEISNIVDRIKQNKVN
ncbi:MAG TPA: hypothetical protein PKD16_19385 [Saprospiraceae bacterium]|mgnify:CR=1 FL=1|jgi:hypothetical protein|nr:hypothetical protein [Saprospiraceae bacterium]HMT72338.1 hypothetical protein [Saprospiraceae bacterium]